MTGATTPQALPAATRRWFSPYRSTLSDTTVSDIPLDSQAVPSSTAITIASTIPAAVVIPSSPPHSPTPHNTSSPPKDTQSSKLSTGSEQFLLDILGKPPSSPSQSSKPRWISPFHSLHLPLRNSRTLVRRDFLTKCWNLKLSRPTTAAQNVESGLAPDDDTFFDVIPSGPSFKDAIVLEDALPEDDFVDEEPEPEDTVAILVPLRAASASTTTSLDSTNVQGIYQHLGILLTQLLQEKQTLSDRQKGHFKHRKYRG
ncbi:hypothetical protein O6H91_Y556600 [Diphasiastrum complanatum]|nr:hypothetical protein O6H91_Y556600 [Diphasiastrum complanatum]KAJ7298534.1 hypothetical protein O6H91_Y556600 [Diphasiastrum complanatum]